jgi:hypothetical protein
VAVTAYATGTLTGQTPGTEDIVQNVAGPGVFNFEVDLINCVAGDVFMVRIYKMNVTSGTARECLIGGPWADVQLDNIKVSIPLMTSLTDAQALRFGITQVAGTAHDVPWKVYAV